MLEDVSFFTQKNNMPGILLSVDFEKAFDSINWNFMFKVLKRFNFGETFIKYVKTIYNDISSTFINNGHASDFFK